MVVALLKARKAAKGLEIRAHDCLTDSFALMALQKEKSEKLSKKKKKEKENEKKKHQ